MKRILVPLCYGAAILLGFLLLSYPMISNYLYEQRQDGVIKRYETLAQDTALDKTRKRRWRLPGSTTASWLPGSSLWRIPFSLPPPRSRTEHSPPSWTSRAPA